MSGYSLTAMSSTEYLAIALFHLSPILSHKDAASTPGTQGMKHHIEITTQIIAIRGGRVDGNDLLDSTRAMPDNWYGDLPLHIAQQDEPMPILICIFPGGVRAKAVLTGVASRAPNIT